MMNDRLSWTKVIVDEENHTPARPPSPLYLLMS